MFASKTPRDLGCTCYWTDPKTWTYYGGAAEPGSQMGPNYECFEHFPHPQHNEPNPVLVEMRENLAMGGPASAESLIGIRIKTLEWMIEAHESSWERLADETVTRVTHARAVLARLQSVDWAAWRAPRLDPEPWRCYQNGERMDGPNHHPEFEPRPGYSQNREDYA